MERRVQVESMTLPVMGGGVSHGEKVLKLGTSQQPDKPQNGRNNQQDVEPDMSQVLN